MSQRAPDPAFDDWIGRAKAASGDEMLALAQTLNPGIKKAGGGEWVGPCRRCAGHDRWSINPKKKVWNCRGSEGGRDAIGMVMHLLECDFIAACEEVTGEPPPRGEGRRMDPEVAKERRKERQDVQRIEDQKQAKVEQAKQVRARDVWDAAKPAPGTMTERYLRGRGMSPSEEHLGSLRFSPSLEYRGFQDEQASEEIVLGSFPCMVAAMYAPNGEITAVHRTYIDPKTGLKLKPPGDAKRNKAKKAFGRAGGAIIRLGFFTRCVAVAEGIETALSWFNLGLGPEDASIAAAYSLGNLSGGSTGTIPHPSLPKKSIQNGEPDPKEPGITLPSVCEEVILLGDGDSDPATTRAHLLTAGRRFRAQGKTVMVHMAPANFDWDDVRVRFERGDEVEIPPIQTFEEFEAEVRTLIKPQFKSQFGGLRWQDLGREKPKYEWLVKGLIARKEVAFLAGPSQSGKSFLVLDIAMSVARGVPWFNRVVRKGAVVYIAAESSQGVVNLRLPAYAAHNQIGYDADLPLLTLTKSPNFYRDEDQVQKLIAEIKAFEEAVGIKVEMVVVDTFSAATRGADEIKGVDMSKIHDRIKMIVAQCATGVLVIHHLNAQGDKLRGHTSLFGDVDSVITCNVHETKKDVDGRPIRIARADKVKEGANRHTIEFVLKQVDLGIDEDGDKVTSCVVDAPARVEEEVEPNAGAYEFKSDAARFVFACLYETIRNKGQPPEAGTPSPQGQRVCAVAQWQDLYARRAPQDETEAPEARMARIRKDISRATKSWFNRGLIGTDNGFVWFTGKAVAGFNTSPIRTITWPGTARSDVEYDMEIPV